MTTVDETSERTETELPLLTTVDASVLTQVRELRTAFRRMQMEYEFAIDEMLTKVSILRREFEHLHRYNPIEHVGSRIKSLESLVTKAIRRRVALTPEAIRVGITDVAGIRITCSFIADTYRLLDILSAQTDLKILQIKDYIAHPKPNGYKSLHAIVEVPVFLSTGPIPVICELQIRTIAMDFWASLEHKIHYKFDGAVPGHLAASLKEAADTAEQLDRRMEQLHAEVRGTDAGTGPGRQPVDGWDRRLMEILKGR